MGSSARRRRPVRERKTARLELRVAPSAKQTIHRAMAVSGLAAGDLAYEAARRILEEHERMTLASADREVFLKAVLRPPAPTRPLIRALRRHHEVFG